MKKILLLIGVLGASCSAYGTPCGSALMSVYDTSGFSCTIGDLTFSDFIYLSATVPDTSVLVTPESVLGETGLEFNNFWGAAPGFSTDSTIEFTVTCDSSCLINDAEITAGGASGTTPGSIADASETSAAFDGTSLSVGAAFGSSTVLSDSVSFAPVSTLTVAKDIGAFGGEITSPPPQIGHGAQISDVANLFSTQTAVTPEPSVLMLCVGVLALIPIARRKLVR